MTASPSGDPARIDVRFRGGSYPVLVGRGLLSRVPGLLAEHAPAHRYAVVSDAHVADLYGKSVAEACSDAGLDALLLTFPRGEAHKTREQWRDLTDRMLEACIGRDGVVVAVGGGVTGDLAGFVAATYLRGVPVVQVPTSLVAMVDASVGGKTGVDVAAGKNLVGAFHPPRVVVADPDTIATLDVEERAQGLAEAVKHGAILDRGYFEDLEDDAQALLAGESRATDRAVRRSVELKARVVEEDEREGGLRQILNFGHTLGHALEAAAEYRVGHGTAVAVGMVLEARLGEREGVTAPGTAERLSRALGAFGLGTLPVGLELEREDVVRFLASDKKARTGRPRYVLLSEIGRVVEKGGWSQEVPGQAVDAVLAEVLNGPRGDHPGARWEGAP